jgi:hypothetical protein
MKVNLTNAVQKPGRAILYLRAFAGEPDEVQDLIGVGEIHRGVFFLREKTLDSKDLQLSNYGVAKPVGSVPSPAQECLEMGKSRE